VGGRDVYVGRYGSPESQTHYLELMVEHGFMPAVQGMAPGDGSGPIAKRDGTPVAGQSPQVSSIEPAEMPGGGDDVPAGLTLGELCRMYLLHLDETRPAGKRCTHRDRALAAIRAMRPLAAMPAAKFGPRAFNEVRQRLVETPRRLQPRNPGEPRGNRSQRRRAQPPPPVVLLSRRWINDVMQAVRVLFDWAVLHDLVPEDRVAVLRVVKPLKHGESKARETPRRKPVRASICQVRVTSLL